MFAVVVLFFHCFYIGRFYARTQAVDAYVCFTSSTQVCYSTESHNDTMHCTSYIHNYTCNVLHTYESGIRLSKGTEYVISLNWRNLNFFLKLIRTLTKAVTYLKAPGSDATRSPQGSTIHMGSLPLKRSSCWGRRMCHEATQTSQTQDNHKRRDQASAAEVGKDISQGQTGKNRSFFRFFRFSFTTA